MMALSPNLRDSPDTFNTTSRFAMGSIVTHGTNGRHIAGALNRRGSEAVGARWQDGPVTDREEFRATLAKRRADVAQMFDGVAQRYDLMNSLMTMGQDQQWRREVVDAVAPRPGERILDLAAGTGTSSRPFADAGATVVPADLSLGMLRVGKGRQPDLSFVNADGLQLPFADASFDCTTISYGLRNVEHTAAALEELRRVTKPGGRVIICEFSTPTWAPFATVYKGYLLTALPLSLIHI